MDVTQLKIEMFTLLEKDAVVIVSFPPVIVSFQVLYGALNLPSKTELTLSHMKTHFDASAEINFSTIVEKGEIANNQQFLPFH